LMVYAAMFGALSSLLAAAYITLYNWGIDFFKQPTLTVLDVNFWPLVMLTVAGVLIGLAIKFTGRHARIGVAQRQYAQTGRISARNLPSIMVQAFITLWSGASVGSEGPLTFLSGGVGSFIAERLKIEKGDLPVLVYSAIAGAFGGFFGSPVVGAVGAIEYMMIKELDIYRHLVPGLLAAAVGRLFRTVADLISRDLQFSGLCFSWTCRSVVGPLGRNDRRSCRNPFQTDFWHYTPYFCSTQKTPCTTCYSVIRDHRIDRFILTIDTLLWSGSIVGNHS
jgi:H+/Cl- antiporter ClcA